SDICLPSMEDISAITGLEEPEALLDFCLALGPTTVAQKLGAQGAMLSDGRRRWRLPPHPCRPVDATGAGDTFGGALLARLVAGDALEA
ncbi:sugar kinase, partial [Klebsiella pneumoniae]|nr:sugar kinase [Klebsiella pneumoniae]